MKAFNTGLALVLATSMNLVTHAAQDVSGIQPSTPSVPAQAAPSKQPDAAARDIQQALQAADGLAPGTVSAAVHAETVILSGDVRDEAQAALALQVAQQHAGGVRVASHVEIERDAPAPARLAKVRLVGDVEKALQADQRTASLGVSVSIDESQVIGLHGLVPTADARRAAEEVAGKVTGVTRVSSHLVIPGEEAEAHR